MAEIYNGLFLIKKPQGWTSHDLVAKTRKILNTKSVGHCGTLDPLASGLMVLLIGEATKLSNYILEKDKAYRVTAKLGLVTDTLDTTGTTLSNHQISKNQSEVLAEVLKLQGEMMLPVPKYSAVKIDGIRMHEMARNGQEIQQPIKPMRFDAFKVTAQGEDWISLDMNCSKGSFVRAWVHELGQKLGCGAAMSALERTMSAPYRIEQAMSVEEFEEKAKNNDLIGSLIPIASALPDYKSLRVSGMDETLMSNGQISHGLKSQLISVFKPGIDQGVRIISGRDQKLMALIGLEEGKGFQIRRVFKY